MELNKDDKLLKEIFDQIQIDPPPEKEMWCKIKENENKLTSTMGKQKPLRHLAAAIILIFLFGSLVLNFPSPAKGIGNIFTTLYESVVGGSIKNIQIKFEREKGESEEPIKEITTIEAKEVSLEEARKNVPFHIKIPSEPIKYELDKINLEQMTQYSYRVDTTYSDKAEGFITFSQENLVGENGKGYMYDKDDAKLKTINLNGISINVLSMKNGFMRAFWTEKSISYEIFGPLTEDDILNFIKSLK